MEEVQVHATQTQCRCRRAAARLVCRLIAFRFRPETILESLVVAAQVELGYVYSCYMLLLLRLKNTPTCMHRIGSDRICPCVMIMIRYVYSFDMIIDPAEIISSSHQLWMHGCG